MAQAWRGGVAAAAGGKVHFPGVVILAPMRKRETWVAAALQK